MGLGVAATRPRDYLQEIPEPGPFKARLRQILSRAKVHQGMHMQTVILGLGNELLGDEGVGVHAIRLLIKEKLPRPVKLVEVGTAILDALPEFEHADHIIVLDAVQHGGVPGTVYKIPLGHCTRPTSIASMHGFDIFRVLALAERRGTPAVMVLGVEPELLQWSLQLSSQVEASLPHLVAAVRSELLEVA